jgi:nucleoid DNA-binding protein
MSGSKVNTLTRRDLVKALMAQGFTARESKRLLSTLIRVMVTALSSKQSVELPFGTLMVKDSPPERRVISFGHIGDRFRSAYRVVLVPNRD